MYHKEKEEAIKLRKKGYALSEISNKLNIAKSTASLWMKNIKLSEEAKIILKAKTSPGHKQTEKTREKISKSHKKLWRLGLSHLDPEHSHTFHTKLEKEIKPNIEKYFNTTNLIPEKIEGIWFDFVNSDFIIEYTTNKTQGITNAINRFKKIKDNRKRYLVAPSRYFGILRRKRLEKYKGIFTPIDIIMGMR